MKNLVVRACSGIVYVGLIVGCILWCYEAYTLLLLFFGILAMNEYQKMTQGEPQSWIQVANRSLDMLVIGFLIIIPFLTNSFFRIDLAIMFGVFALALYPVIRFVLALYDKSRTALVGTAWSMLGTIYIGVGLALTSCVYLFSPELMLITFIMIWLNDTGAYCVGSMLGKHRLFERLSPKKSWEGFWGGFAFDIIAGVVCYFCLGESSQSIWWWIGLGAVVSVIATWGDLFESLIKRTEGVKDAGNLIPGHGGILDRIDSLLFVGPIVAVYVFIFGTL